jgi:hypothetical protein
MHFLVVEQFNVTKKLLRKKKTSQKIKPFLVSANVAAAMENKFGGLNSSVR